MHSVRDFPPEWKVRTERLRDCGVALDAGMNIIAAAAFTSTPGMVDQPGTGALSRGRVGPVGEMLAAQTRMDGL